MPSFADLGLPEPVLRALTAGGFTAPFPIQAATLPETLAGRDLLGRGQTGSGKTLAFGLAMLSRLAGDRAQARRPRGLVLVPTRELAQQVVDAVVPYAKALGLTVTSVVGGMSFNRQAVELQRGVDLLVATPGRLTDHTNQRTCDLSAIEVTAIDEADRMADMGFLPQVRAILDLTPTDGQRLLFSATLDGEVATLVRRYLHDPVTRAVVLVHVTGRDDGAPPARRRHDRQAARRHRDRRAGRAHHPVRPHQARRGPAGEDAASGRDRRRSAARREGAERPQPRDRRVQGGPHAGPGGHGRGRARHPRRRREPRRARRPAGRPEGLPAPRRSDGAGRRVGHRGHDGDPARAPRGGPAHPHGRRPRHQHRGRPRRHGADPDHRRPYPERCAGGRAAEARAERTAEAVRTGRSKPVPRASGAAVAGVPAALPDHCRTHQESHVQG